MSNLNPGQSAEQVIEQEKPISTTPVSENAQVKIVVPTLQDNGIQSELENNVNEELSKFE
ncbi:hypothetical protein II582_01875 [bacterium]|nr:hypothetical protein [bacterium]